MKKALLLFVLLSSIFSYSQSKSFEISGTLISKHDAVPVESATVYLQRVKDSTLITYTISDAKGKFLLENKTSDKKAVLFVSYIGYKTYTKEISLNKQTIALGNINLEENANTLDAVVIKAQAPPITIKKDTLEFNVKSFKTKKDANVEDLLKKLPGVEVDENGKIKINGKEVNKILVNGKPFFSNDPTIATKNLSKEMIEKIQVSNTKTDQEAFTGEDGEQSNKTVNLVIKKENNKGVFGRLAAGGGTDERYEYAGMFNRFDNDLRFSVLAGGNNINSPGFSYGEISKMFGGSSSRSINNQINNWGQDGIITSNNSGLNYVDTWGKNFDVSTNYFGSKTNTDNVSKSETENILPTNRYFTNSTSKSNKESQKHSSDSKFKIKIDSTFLITLTPEFNQTITKNTSYNTATSINTENDTINKSTSNNLSETINNSFSNNLSISKRLSKKGSFLKFYMYNKLNNNENTSKINNQVIVVDDEDKNTSVNQFREGDKKSSTFVLETKYQVPLIEKKLTLNMGIGYRKNRENNVQNSYDYNDDTMEYESDINENFSSDFEYDNITTTPSLQLQYKKDKWSSTFKTEYLLRTLKNSDFLRPEFNLKRNFYAPQITYRLNYRAPKTNLSLNYNLSNQAPNIYQIQPFENITNPLNTIVGNPSLLPTKRHMMYVNFSKNNYQKGENFYSYIYANTTEDQIVSKSEINEDLTRRTTYTNLDGQYNLYTYISYNKKIKLDSIKNIRLGVGGSANMNKSYNFIDEQKYASVSKGLSPNLSVRFDWKDVTDINLSYRPTYTKSAYDTELLKSQEFTVHRVNLNTTNYFSKKLEFRNEINYNYNPTIADGFDKNAWFWNATVSYSMLKDKAHLSLKVYDLLNQNTNARQYAYQNIIVDRQSTVLQQYFMLSFSWKFNSLGKKGEVRSYR